MRRSPRDLAVDMVPLLRGHLHVDHQIDLHDLPQMPPARRPPATPSPFVEPADRRHQDPHSVECLTCSDPEAMGCCLCAPERGAVIHWLPSRGVAGPRFGWWERCPNGCAPLAQGDGNPYAEWMAGWTSACWFEEDREHPERLIAHPFKAGMAGYRTDSVELPGERRVLERFHRAIAPTCEWVPATAGQPHDSDMAGRSR